MKDQKEKESFGRGLAIEAVTEHKISQLVISSSLDIARPETITNFNIFGCMLADAYQKGVASWSAPKIDNRAKAINEAALAAIGQAYDVTPEKVDLILRAGRAVEAKYPVTTNAESMLHFGGITIKENPALPRGTAIVTDANGKVHLVFPDGVQMYQDDATALLRARDLGVELQKAIDAMDDSGFVVSVEQMPFKHAMGSYDSIVSVRTHRHMWPKEVIPGGIYFDAKTETFYTSLGGELDHSFNKKWFDRRAEFPKEAHIPAHTIKVVL